MNADYKDERRSNRWTQIKQMNADQTWRSWRRIGWGWAWCIGRRQLGMRWRPIRDHHPAARGGIRGGSRQNKVESSRVRAMGGGRGWPYPTSKRECVCVGGVRWDCSPCQSIVSFEWNCFDRNILVASWPCPQGQRRKWTDGIYRGIYRVRLTFDSVAGPMSCRWKIAS